MNLFFFLHCAFKCQVPRLFMGQFGEIKERGNLETNLFVPDVWVRCNLQHVQMAKAVHSSLGGIHRVR